MKTSTPSLMLAGLLACAVSSQAVGQGPVQVSGQHDPWLGQTIARQGNQALEQIRVELRRSLQREAQAALATQPVAGTGLALGAMPEQDCACVLPAARASLVR